MSEALLDVNLLIASVVENHVDHAIVIAGYALPKGGRAEIRSPD